MANNNRQSQTPKNKTREDDVVFVLHNGSKHKTSFKPYAIEDRILRVTDLRSEAMKLTGTSTQQMHLMRNGHVLDPWDSTLWHHNIITGDTVRLVAQADVELEQREYDVREAERQERDPRCSRNEGDAARRRLGDLRALRTIPALRRELDALKEERKKVEEDPWGNEGPYVGGF
ncbi:hypothetical protein MMC11_003495 [Xylographa trunciseda]|nr:hypothetical protein [Xylographa trunciseda]